MISFIASGGRRSLPDERAREGVCCRHLWGAPPDDQQRARRVEQQDEDACAHPLLHRVEQLRGELVDKRRGEALGEAGDDQAEQQPGL